MDSVSVTRLCQSVKFCSLLFLIKLTINVVSEKYTFITVPTDSTNLKAMLLESDVGLRVSCDSGWG